ncbi:hypothetical protein, partial [Thomasclavelia cocleata]|uniref:hypothetical protein n=1 Tax=Thomasclavelia cocleata TaxID=69824 RepID=UPI001559B986
MKFKICKIDKYVSVVCFISVISQIPFFYQNAILSMIPNIAWVFLTLFLIRIKGNNLKLNIIVLLPAMFDVYCIILQIISGNNYISSNLFKPVNMCTFLFIAGTLVSDYFNHDSLVSFSKSYIAATVVTSFFIYVEYFLGKSIASGGYLYGGKNSLATIIFTAVILLIMMWKKLTDSKFKKILSIFSLIFFIYFLLLLKSRTVLF